MTDNYNWTSITEQPQKNTRKLDIVAPKLLIINLFFFFYHILNQQWISYQLRCTAAAGWWCRPRRRPGGSPSRTAAKGSAIRLAGGTCVAEAQSSPLGWRWPGCPAALWASRQGLAVPGWDKASRKIGSIMWRRCCRMRWYDFFLISKESHVTTGLTCKFWTTFWKCFYF